MTQFTPISPEEEVVDEYIPATQVDSDLEKQKKNRMRNATWGASLLTAAGLLFVVVGFFIAEINSWKDYVLLGAPAVLFILGLISITLLRRGKVVLGTGLIFVANLIMPLVETSLQTEIGIVVFVYTLISSVLLIWRSLPRSSRRWASVLTGIALLVIMGIELVNSPIRISPADELVTFIYIITALLVLSFIVQAAQQAWNQNNIRSRFLTFSLGLTLIAATIIAVVSVSSLISAGQQAQETSSKVLREQAQETLVHQTVDVAGENELVLQVTNQAAHDVAQQAAYIFENPNAFNTESFWKADDHMFLGPLGQYINGEGDVSTVFVPNSVRITDSFKKRLELLAYLDMALVPVYESDPNSAAIYFVGTDDTSWLHPNINLGAIVPADYRATQDIFYTTGTPENNPERQVVWTPVYDDPAGQGLLVSAIAPVYTSSNRFMGIIGIDVSLAGLTAAIEQEELDAGGYSFMLDADGRALALPEQGYLDFLGRERETGEFGVDFVASARPEFASVISDMLSGSTDFQSVEVDGQELYIAYTTMENTGWRVVGVVAAEQVLAPATALQTELEQLSGSLVFGRILPVGVVFIILVVVAGVFFTNRLVSPIEQLTEGAAKIGVGEWDTPLPKSELREIDGLSRTLSNMATQLKSTLGTLEQRVADRTRNLELAAEVGRSVSQVRDLDVMLRDACDLILQEFDLYYVQVYLTDPSQRNLILEAGTGDVGAQLRARGHSLQFNAGSINGRAAVEKRTVVIADTAESATFRPNPLLPDTRGEMAVPLIVGDQVVGVLDMQTTVPGALNEEVLPAFEALAGQLAVAIQNANLVAEAQEARAEVEAQARRLVRASWDEHLDAIHKPEQFGFVFDRNEVTPLAEMEESQLPEDGRAVSAPIALTGEMLGSLVVEIDEEHQNEQTSELVNIVARQVAQQLENLRLLESSERYRFESEQASRRQTREGWKEYIGSRSKDSLGYLYDLKEVRPHSNGQDDPSALTLPLKVHDEKVGKLSIQGLAIDDKESFELATAVAERLGAHIENLRLSEQTKQSLALTDELYDISQSVNEAASEPELLEALAKPAMEAGAMSANLMYIDVDAEGNPEWTEIVADWRLEGEAPIPVGTRFYLPELPFSKLWMADPDNPLLVSDVSTDDRLDDATRAAMERGGTRGIAIIPLTRGQDRVGLVTLNWEKPHEFGQHEKEAYTAIIGLASPAVHGRRLFEQAQKQAERETMLNTINQKIQSATSVEAVLQIAARELGHALGAPMTIAQLSMKEQN